MATIDSVDLYLGLSSAESGFNVVVEIYTLGNYANDPDVGILLGSKAIDVDNIPLISGVGPDWVTFTFDTPITVSDNDFAGIVFDSLGGNFNSTSIRHYEAQNYDYYTSGAKAGKERCYISLTGNWIDQGAGLCLCYRINGTDITQNVADNPSASYEALGGSQHGFRAYVDGASTPTKAENPSPTNSATEVDFSGLQLSWDDGGGADTFDVYIGPSGALTQVASAQAGTTYTTTLAELEGVFSAAPIEQVIYWRIDSTNIIGTTTGDEWNFDARPAKPITPAPIDTATDQLLGLGTVSWIDGGNADTYDVHFGLQGNPILQSSGQAGLSWPIGGPLLYNNTYEWNINAINIFGTTTGDTWTFSDIVFFPPLPSGVTLVGNSGPNGEGTPTGTPTGFNNVITVKRLVAAADGKLWYEDVS